MTGWRGWAVAAGCLVVACGAVILLWGGGPMPLIFGVLMIVTAALEPIYGRATGKPAAGSWQPTGERFVDPESGRLVTVWFDRRTGQRRYVDEEATEQPPT